MLEERKSALLEALDAEARGDKWACWLAASQAMALGAGRVGSLVVERSVGICLQLAAGEKVSQASRTHLMMTARKLGKFSRGHFGTNAQQAVAAADRLDPWVRS